MLCCVQTHPEYIDTPIAEALDPYTLAYTILLLKELGSGALRLPMTKACTVRHLSRVTVLGRERLGFSKP